MTVCAEFALSVQSLHPVSAAGADIATLLDDNSRNFNGLSLHKNAARTLQFRKQQ